MIMFLLQEHGKDFFVDLYQHCMYIIVHTKSGGLWHILKEIYLYSLVIS